MQVKFYFDDYGFHFRTRIFNINIEIQIYKTYKTTQTFGIRNLCPDGTRIIFTDYDEHLLEHIIPEIKSLQQRHRLSDFYIFKSGNKPNGFHAVNIDKLRYKEFIRIINETSADEYYRNMPIKVDEHSWVLRTIRKGTSPSPKLIRIIRSPYQKREKSLAHYLYLKYQHGIMKRPKNLDKNKILYTIQYGTMNFTNAETLKTKK
jgi:hypothetical protein